MTTNTRALFLSAALAIGAAAQTTTSPVQPVPETIIKVARIYDKGEIGAATVRLAELEVTGAKPITAVVLWNASPPQGRGHARVQDFAVAPKSQGDHFLYGAVWDNSDLTNTYVAAVIFEDGSHLGDAAAAGFEGRTEIQLMMDRRQGSAEEWAKWRRVAESLSKQDAAAIPAFQARVRAEARRGNPNPVPLHHPPDLVEMGRYDADLEALYIVEQIDSAIASGRQPASIRHELIDTLVADRAAASAKAAAVSK